MFWEVEPFWPDAGMSLDLAMRRVAAFFAWYIADRALRRDGALYRGLQRDGRAIGRRTPLGAPVASSGLRVAGPQAVASPGPRLEMKRPRIARAS